VNFDAFHTVQTLNLPVEGGVVPAIGDGVLDAQKVMYGMGNTVGTVTECAGSAGPAVCVTSTFSENPDPTYPPWDGCTWLFDLPLLGNVPVLDARARYIGDPGERAEVALGDGDLDGDGVQDLLIGAYGSLGTGRVAVVLSPPDGEHRVWDVAQATLTGEVYGAELGLGMAVGDLNGDGHEDVVAGAPLQVGGGAAYVFAGPFAGDRTTSTADWTVSGTSAGQWVGYDAAIGDLDGDGAADLAVGAPWSLSAQVGEGRVLVYPAPAPGAYTDQDAPTVLTSGVGVADGFGFRIEGGDIDGDGLYDLVVGAPTDPTAGALAGSATIVFGASLP
jgi:hypothetical protein